MSEIRIYHKHVYYILQGGNVAVFNSQLKMVRHEKVLDWLTNMRLSLIPEIPPGTEEYNRVLDEYKQMINRLPLLANTA